MSAQLIVIEGFPARHAFTLRHRGVSGGDYATLNLGDAVGDDPERVMTNRELALRQLGVDARSLRLLRQVHGDRIVEATADRHRSEGWPEADAHVSVDPGVALAISVADCFPILFFDTVTGAAAAAHCGWKGTSSLLAAKVVEELQMRYGAQPGDLSVAIGPGIGGNCYQVGGEVVARFAANGFPSSVWRSDDEGRFRLDLARANTIALVEAGVGPERIFRDPSCTHCQPERFFSYRRDGTTGRHWAVVRPAAVGSMQHGTSTGDHAAPPCA